MLQTTIARLTHSSGPMLTENMGTGSDLGVGEGVGVATQTAGALVAGAAHALAVVPPQRVLAGDDLEVGRLGGVHLGLLSGQRLLGVSALGHPAAAHPSGSVLAGHVVAARDQRVGRPPPTPGSVPALRIAVVAPALCVMLPIDVEAPHDLGVRGLPFVQRIPWPIGSPPAPHLTAVAAAAGRTRGRALDGVLLSILLGPVLPWQFLAMLARGMVLVLAAALHWAWRMGVA